MKKTILFLTLLASPACASRPAIPSKALVCSSQSQIDEAIQATDRGDIQWLGGIRGCFFSTESMKARRIDCSGRTCKVRLFSNHGEGSILAYTLRNYLSD